MKLVERSKREVPDTRRNTGEIHANTARRLRSVWVAVPSLADAVKQSERFGFAFQGKRYFTELGEEGQIVQCGLGTIVFFEQQHQNSPLTELVKKHGFGPFGVSVEVKDIKTAQSIVEQGMRMKFEIQQMEGRNGFIVPAEFTAGTFIEFIQQ
jgi:hypothetical protein